MPIALSTCELHPGIFDGDGFDEILERRMDFVSRALIVTFALLVSTFALAQQQLKYGMTDQEISRLPDYCRARLVGDEPTKKAWSQRMGNDKWQHLHHYCSGLNAFHKLNFVFDRRDRDALLRFSLHEFNYVLSAWPADFYLAKEAQSMKMRLIAMGAR